MSRAALSDFQSAVERATATERRRIARGLHDDLGQLLASMALIIDELSAADTMLRQHATQRLAGLALNATNMVRTLTFDLRQDSPAELGVVDELRSLASWLADTHGIPCQFTEPVGEIAGHRIASAVIHVSREVLVNVARHSKAQAVHMSLSADGVQVCVTISDDGVGFSFDPTGSAPSSGSGLGIIRERLDEVGGSLSIRSGEEGTMVSFSAPLVETAPSRTPA